MNYEKFQDFSKKFRTLQRDTMYHEIRDNDRTGIFNQMVSIFLMAFAIGFNKQIRKTTSGSGSINHVNASAIDPDTQNMIIMLMLDRHPEIDSPDKRDMLWSFVEEYAEGGIGILHDSLVLSEWVLDSEAVIGSSE